MSTITSGSPLRPIRSRSSANAPASSGNACAGVQAPRGEASSVPEPTSTASEQARSSPITNRSAALAREMSLFDPGTAGIAVTPSMLCDEFANTRGSSNPSVPPYSSASLSGSGKAGSPGGSQSTTSGSISGEHERRGEPADRCLTPRGKL